MAYKQTVKEKKAEVHYKSTYGSHSDMINEDYVEFNSGDHGMVICKDNRGDYVTLRKFLDCGLCDYNRSVNIEAREAKLKETLESK
jgi:hypothetical protein